MQIEVYDMKANGSEISITLEAVCDSFSSLLWDVTFYDCGRFEIYIATNPRNLNIFKIGKIVGRDDDKTHFGIIESVSLETDTENGDYLTVTGRFLMSLLSRRIIYPTLSFTTKTSYGEMLQKAVRQNCMTNDSRLIPGLQIGKISGACWEQTARLQVSYDNLMEWIYKICELVGGTANIRLQETTVNSGQYRMLFELSEGMDRSILQDENPRLIFSDSYNNLLNFAYSADSSAHTNTAYTLGCGEGDARKRAIFFHGEQPKNLDHYEVNVDAKDIQQETQVNGKTVQISDAEYLDLLQEKGTENLNKAQFTIRICTCEIFQQNLAIGRNTYKIA